MADGRPLQGLPFNNWERLRPHTQQERKRAPCGMPISVSSVRSQESRIESSLQQLRTF